MKADSRPVTLAISIGDPRGIGPEVILKAAAGRALPGARLVIVGGAAVLRATAANLQLPCPASVDDPVDMPDETAVVLDTGTFPATALEPRKPDSACGRASLQYVECAVNLVREGTADAIVTGPINKAAIGAAGSPYPGHTEMLAHLAGGGTPVMLMVCPGLRVALVTTHLRLLDVAGSITADSIVRIGRVLYGDLRRYFGIQDPQIAVCGVNPHCGDDARFGDEETRIIAPALRRLESEGVHLTGPLPADTVFCQAIEGRSDAVLAMYHDQGLIPVKMAGLDRVVNVTLGLPIIRTSVGHGTAYDIAGRGVASDGSFREAVRVAAEMARAVRARD